MPVTRDLLGEDLPVASSSSMPAHLPPPTQRSKTPVKSFDSPLEVGPSPSENDSTTTSSISSAPTPSSHWDNDIESPHNSPTIAEVELAGDEWSEADKWNLDRLKYDGPQPARKARLVGCGQWGMDGESQAVLKDIVWGSESLWDRLGGRAASRIKLPTKPSEQVTHVTMWTPDSFALLSSKLNGHVPTQTALKALRSFIFSRPPPDVEEILQYIVDDMGTMLCMFLRQQGAQAVSKEALEKKWWYRSARENHISEEHAKNVELVARVIRGEATTLGQAYGGERWWKQAGRAKPSP